MAGARAADMLCAMSVFEQLKAKLDAAGIAYTVREHEPVFTSEAAARVRGVPLASGAKALVVKIDETFRHFVLPADRKFDSKKARKALAARKSRFATREEVADLTGLEPGAIPPFGSLFGLETICDPALGDNETINFNAGDHAISVSMSYADFVRVESPTSLEVT